MSTLCAKLVPLTQASVVVGYRECGEPLEDGRCPRCDAPDSRFRVQEGT